MLRLLMVGLLSILWTRPVVGEELQEIPTFLFVGQSNMTGADSVATPELTKLCGEEWNARFWNRSAWQGKEWENDSEFHGLRVQKTAGYCADVIGPEVGFIQALRSRGEKREVVLLKVSFPGSDLAADWKKGSEQGIKAYAALQEEFEQASKELAKQNLKPNVVGIFVHQGISDAHDGNGFTAAQKSAAYPENLTKFIADIRHDFASPNTPVVLARENISPFEFVDRKSLLFVRETVVDSSNKISSVAWIDVDDLERVQGHHFTAAAQMTIGKRFEEAWNKLKD